METENPPQDINISRSSQRSLFPVIAGILLIISGVAALLYWILVIVNADFFTSMFDLSQLQTAYPDITLTPETIKQMLIMCGTILCIVSIFPIFGGVLSIKKKIWGIALACSIIGIFSLGFSFISSILSLIAMILLILARKEFQ